VDALSLRLALERVFDAVEERTRALQVVTLNAEMVMQAQSDPELALIIKECALVVPDGSGVVWALARQGVRTSKVAGIALVEALLAAAAASGHGVYFLGAKPGVAKEAALVMQAKYPGLRVVGVNDGYFSSAQEAQVLEDIRQAAPAMMFVGLGVPRQEKWLKQFQASIGVPVAMGVGGSFDVLAGRVKRAPALFQKLHLEWFYRLIQEPWRFKRMGSTLPRFVLQVLSRGAQSSMEVRLD
jgi:N-acetylglucosaminyldiphosphoundecaprenol N-acetyl-beta-D-mannosaminyltransferase